MELDIAIPAHNESEVILPTLRLLSDELAKIDGCTWRIIVAENGSSDDTYETVANAKLPHVEVFRAKGRGKGAALKEAAARSSATYFGFTDADSSPDPKAFSKALQLLVRRDADLVIGSRFHPDTVSDRGFLRHNSSRIFNLLARTIVGVSVHDTQCPLKVMNLVAKNELLNTKENAWLVDLEFIARAERAGLRVASVPVAWTEFRYPFRKSKLSLGRDGMSAIIGMLELRKRFETAQHYGAQSI